MRAPQRDAAAPKPGVATAVLTPLDRVAREPLPSWAGRLGEQLDRNRTTIRGTRALAERVGFIGNNAGLVAAHRGDLRAAWALTERQLWWHGRQARRSRDGAVAAFGVQPWINLGRLEALAGRWREALARFAGLASYDVAGRLEMGCVRLAGPAWAALAPSRGDFVGFLDSVHVTDSLKALLLNRRFERVEPFVARLGPSAREAEDLRCVCQEACVVAECHTGDPARAAARARTAAHDARGWSRAVLRLRAAEAHACAGEIEAAAEILAELSAAIRKVSGEQKAKPSLLPITARLAAACHEAGLAGDAHAVARDVLEGARAARDEPIQFESLRILAATAPADERAGWEDALAELEEATEYVRYRRGGPPPPNPVIEGLYEQLAAVFAS